MDKADKRFEHVLDGAEGRASTRFGSMLNVAFDQELPGEQ
jgi:hypothetical protein